MNELLEAAKIALQVLRETQRHGGGEAARKLERAIKKAENQGA